MRLFGREIGKRSGGKPGGNAKAVGLATATATEPVALSVRLEKGTLQVDREGNGALRGVSIISAGPAIGHEFVIDEVMLQQVADAINATDNGIKTRLSHPWLEDAVFYRLGKASNATVDGNKVRGDIVFGKYAQKSPKGGNLTEFVLDLVDEDAADLGVSIVFEPADYEERTDPDNDMPLAPASRLKRLLAVDIVDDPAANPDGMLSARDTDKTGGKRPPEIIGTNKGLQGEKTMDPKLRAFLEAMGLAADANDAAAELYLQTLTGKAQEFATKLAAKNTDKPQLDAGKTATEPTQDPEQLAKLRVEAVAGERTRFVELRAIASQAKLDADWVQEQFTAGTSVDDARKAALAKLTDANKPLNLSDSQNIHVGTDRNASTLGGAISDAILQRAGVNLVEMDESGQAVRDGEGRLQTRQANERSREFRALSLVEMARGYLRNVGIPGVETLGRNEVANLVLVPQRLQQRYGSIALAQSTGDFPYILEDAIRKSLRIAYAEAPLTWNAWARRTTNPDFKTIKRVALSEAPDLTERPEGGDLQYVTLSESRETYVLVEYAQAMRLTRQAIINDDLDAFGRIPQLQAGGAARKEDDVAYAVITGNAALADSIALFHASHSNLATGAGAPSTTTLNAAYSAIGNQTGPKGGELNLAPKFILAPLQMFGTVMQLLGSTVDPSATAANVKNVWQNGLTPVFNSRLGSNSTTAWYVLADYNQVDTVEMCFLEGEQVPVLSQETVFGTGDVNFAVRHTVAAKAIDYRGMYMHAGA